jgi:tetratricopeptide (TPR) repeat protein
MAASTVLGLRGASAPRLKHVLETTNPDRLAFFNAYVKRDSAELAFLRRDPAANGAPAGLATIRELPAVQPAPTPQTFETMIREQGVETAMTAFRAAQANDPRASLFTPFQMNRLGYRLLRSQKVPEAVAVFRKAVELAPGSSNAYDSLAEALEAAGQRAEALDVARRGLDVLQREEVTAEQRQQMKTALERKVQRLTAGS